MLRRYQTAAQRITFRTACCSSAVAAPVTRQFTTRTANTVLKPNMRIPSSHAAFTLFQHSNLVHQVRLHSTTRNGRSQGTLTPCNVSMKLLDAKFKKYHKAVQRSYHCHLKQGLDAARAKRRAKEDNADTFKQTFKQRTEGRPKCAVCGRLIHKHASSNDDCASKKRKDLRKVAKAFRPFLRPCSKETGKQGKQRIAEVSTWKWQNCKPFVVLKTPKAAYWLPKPPAKLRPAQEIFVEADVNLDDRVPTWNKWQAVNAVRKRYLTKEQKKLGFKFSDADGELIVPALPNLPAAPRRDPIQKAPTSLAKVKAIIKEERRLAEEKDRIIKEKDGIIEEERRIDGKERLWLSAAFTEVGHVVWALPFELKQERKFEERPTCAKRKPRYYVKMHFLASRLLDLCGFSTEPLRELGIHNPSFPFAGVGNASCLPADFKFRLVKTPSGDYALVCADEAGSWLRKGRLGQIFGEALLCLYLNFERHDELGTSAKRSMHMVRVTNTRVAFFRLEGTGKQVQDLANGIVPKGKLVLKTDVPLQGMASTDVTPAGAAKMRERRGFDLTDPKQRRIIMQKFANLRRELLPKVKK